MSGVEALEDAGLFEMEAPPPVTLADKFLFPPFSVLDRRSGPWQERKRKWLSMGIRSEVGRDGGLTRLSLSGRVPTYYDQKTKWEKELGRTLPNKEFEENYLEVPKTGALAETGTSVFDPVLAELFYRWMTLPGAPILDPFAGGSVRGIVASHLQRPYTGVELRPEQVESNGEQAQEMALEGFEPQWLVGDATALDEVLPPGRYDGVFTCPPYANLEVYSDDPRDLSNMPYDRFLEGYLHALHSASERLNDGRFMGVVISDVREKGNGGAYRGLVADTIIGLQHRGLQLYNDAITIDPVGAIPQILERHFRAGRKFGRCHQHLLIFAKGGAKAAAEYATSLEEGRAA